MAKIICNVAITLHGTASFDTEENTMTILYSKPMRSGNLLISDGSPAGAEEVIKFCEATEIAMLRDELRLAEKSEGVQVGDVAVALKGQAN